MACVSPVWRAGQRRPGGKAARRCTNARMRMMSVEEFQDRDADYLGWVAAHPDGYAINIGRSRRGG